LKLSIKQITDMLKDKEIYFTRDFNPITHTQKFKKVQGKYKTIYHTSVDQARKLFGQIVEKKISQTDILKLAEQKGVKQPTKVGSVQARKPLQKNMVREFVRSKVILGGGKAQNLQLPLWWRRWTTDFDGQISRGASLVLQRIADSTNKQLGVKRYYVRPGGHKGTYKLIDISKPKKSLIELTNEKNIQKEPYVVNKQGLRVKTIKGLLYSKADAVNRLERFVRKGAKDITDILRLSRGKIKVKDVLIKKRNPSDVFEVVRQPQGMGKSRLAFDETHMYFDFEIPVGYSKGKAYTIIKFPVTKISKFPKGLRVKVAKAALGQLSGRQQVLLRRQLNAYIKANKNKFFLSPRTAANVIGEREVVTAEGSKFIKSDVYKTFDNDLQKFVKLIEVGFGKRSAKPMIGKFIDGWKKKPFRQLKLRLTNPDLLKVRRYTRLLNKDIKLSKNQKNNIVVMLRKLFISKKAQVALGGR
jgi:nucleoside-triphosphatase THEP1